MAAGQATSQVSGQTTSKEQAVAHAEDLEKLVTKARENIDCVTGSSLTKEEEGICGMFHSFSVSEIKFLAYCRSIRCANTRRQLKIDLIVTYSKLQSDNKEIFKTFVDDLIKDINGMPMRPPEDDAPIDAISHTVTFIVVMNANATPTWSLMKFKGPGGATSAPTSGGTSGSTTPAAGTSASGSFISASRSDTHTLLITLGKGASAEAVRNSSLIGNAIGTAIQTLQTVRP
jgi:hypothetical protein